MYECEYAIIMPIILTTIILIHFYTLSEINIFKNPQ